jgi:nucleoside-triphosphatase
LKLGSTTKRIFLTGLPGSGKSTVLMKVIENLKKKRFKIGGFITPEIRVKGKRIGFKVIDISSGEEGILASIDQKFGPRLGKYRINLEDFERVALKALDFALNKCNVVCVDELGKMELFSEKFKERVERIFKSSKPAIIVLHRSLIEEYKKYGRIIWVTPENRDKLPEEIMKNLNL